MARRRKKQSDIEDAIDETTPKAGHNGSGLDEDETRALLFQHKKAYEGALASKKAADAKFKNACKLAKAELGKDAVADIKAAIAIEEPGGEAALQAEIERKLRIARWMGAAVGTQFTFSEDMAPADERAFEDGKRVGLAGDPCKPPHDPGAPQYQPWMDGFNEGQGVLAGGIKAKPADDEPRVPQG